MKIVVKMVGKIAKGPKQTKKPGSKGKGKKVAPPPIPVATKIVAKKPVTQIARVCGLYRIMTRRSSSSVFK